MVTKSPGRSEQRSGTPSGPAPQAAARTPRIKLLGVAAVLLVASVAAAWFVLLGDNRSDPEAEVKAEHGPVLALDPVSLNLAEGRYLRVSLALQLSQDTAEEPDGSKALDIAINTLSGRQAAELNDGSTREAIKAELSARVAAAYPDDVIEVYFTQFVIQ